MDAPIGPSPSAPFAVPTNASRFNDIVTRERARLGNFIRAQVRNAADAEDILQDVLLEFYLAADAVEQTFPSAAEPAGWRRQAQALRVRGELAWHSNTGGHRRKAMKALNAETAEVLSQVNARLIDLQGRFSPELDA